MNKFIRIAVLVSVSAAFSVVGFACADEVARQACSDCSGDVQDACEEVISDCVRDDLLTTSECNDLGEAVCVAQP